MYDAPFYEGSNKLRGFAAIVTGGDSGIGRSVAVLFAREGADVAIVYLNEHKDAEETKRAVEAEGTRTILISGDVTDRAFCDRAVGEIVKESEPSHFHGHKERQSEQDCADECAPQAFGVLAVRGALVLTAHAAPSMRALR